MARPTPAKTWRATLTKITQEAGPKAALDSAAEWLGALSATCEECRERLRAVRQLVGPVRMDPVAPTPEAIAAGVQTVRRDPPC